MSETTTQSDDEIVARLKSELSPKQWHDVDTLLDITSGHFAGEYEERHARVIRALADHFPSFGPAIVGITAHAVANIDDPCRLDPELVCNCMEAAEA